MKHSLEVASIFYLVTNGHKYKPSRPSHPTTDFSKSKSGASKTKPDNQKGKGNQDVLSSHLCFKAQGLRHLIKDCQFPTKEEKDTLFQSLCRNRTKDTPAEITRSMDTIGDAKRATDRISKEVLTDSFSCFLILSGSFVSLLVNGICHDGCVRSLISPKITERFFS